MAARLRDRKWSSFRKTSLGPLSGNLAGGGSEGHGPRALELRLPIGNRSLTIGAFLNEMPFGSFKFPLFGRIIEEA